MATDLTTPTGDPATWEIIRRSTDPAVRHQVATDPVVIAIIERADRLTTDQRRRIGAAHDEWFAIHRQTWIRLRHRVRHAGGPDNLTVRAINEKITDLYGCPGDPFCKPKHYCPVGFPLAVQDMVFAHLAAAYLTGDEIRLLTASFVDVAGQVRP